MTKAWVSDRKSRASKKAKELHERLKREADLEKVAQDWNDRENSHLVGHNAFSLPWWL